MTIYLATLIVADQGHMGDFDFAWWWIPMMVGMALFWGLVIVGIVWLIRSGGGSSAEKKMSAVEVLERRFAEGDLTVEEYRERRAVLTGRPDARPLAQE